MEVVKKTRKQSQLQQLKTAVKSSNSTSEKDLPKNLKELKDLKYRELALKFSNEFISGHVTSKDSFCKRNHISHDSLNRGLKTLGCQTTPRRDNNKENQSESSLNKTEKEQLRLKNKLEKKDNDLIKDMEKLKLKISKQKDDKQKAGFLDENDNEDSFDNYVKKNFNLTGTKESDGSIRYAK